MKELILFPSFTIVLSTREEPISWQKADGVISIPETQLERSLYHYSAPGVFFKIKSSFYLTDDNLTFIDGERVAMELYKHFNRFPGTNLDKGLLFATKASVGRFGGRIQKVVESPNFGRLNMYQYLKPSK